MGAPPDYIDVAERIAEFRDKYPSGSFQQVDVQFIDFANKCWVVYTAAAYRTPDDERPGHGTAWEPVPGPTNFTRDSELQNAETSAWGRAIVAVLAADTKRGVASANEVRNRTENLTVQQKLVRAANETDTGAVKWASHVRYGKSNLEQLSDAQASELLSALSADAGAVVAEGREAAKRLSE